MIFNSLVFALFFPIVFVGHWVVRGVGARRLWLLAASYVFYGWWDWRLLGLIAGASAVAHVAALHVEKGGPNRTVGLVAAIGLLLGVLGVFKYYGFFLESLAPVLAGLGVAPDALLVKIVLPVGISFYVFQAISYVVDVYRGVVRAERSPLITALYVAFFPQLIAGPIVRASHMLPQLRRRRRLSGRMVGLGVRLFLLGFVYKVALADNLAPFADPVFAAPETYDRLSILWATVAFHGQIYFDFAGYSTMAVGLALLLGYRVPRNFRHPYGAASPSEFWKRWHVTLSRWFRDYLYIPLGGNRAGVGRVSLNLMLTMALAGLWHGAAWTFVLWGVAHGAALIVQRLLRRVSKGPLGWPLLLAGFCLTQAFVLASWTAFRAESWDDLVIVWEVLLGLREGGPQSLPPLAAFLVLPVVADHVAGAVSRRRHRRKAAPARKPPVVVYWVAVGVILGVTLMVHPLTSQPFIYFQF